MIKKLKILSIASLVFVNLGFMTAAATVALPATAAAQFKSDACNGVNQVGGQTCGGQADGTISKLMSIVLNLLSLAAGFIAVVMVIIAGIKFMTANGDASQISSARQSIIYALAGVIVAAMAQIIVHFVFGKVTKGIF